MRCPRSNSSFVNGGTVHIPYQRNKIQMSIIWKIGLEILLKQIEVPVLNPYEQVILFCFDVRIFVFPISNLDEIVQRFKKLLAQTFCTCPNSHKSSGQCYVIMVRAVQCTRALAISLNYLCGHSCTRPS